MDELSGKDLVITLLTDHYDVAVTGDRHMTTTEMFDTLREHAPKMFTEADVFQAMKQLGYRTKLVGEEIRWLVRGR